jgi:hypothetical protein
MLDAPARSDRVGAQWLGLARDYRRQVKVEDRAFDAAIVQVTAPLKGRLKRHPPAAP